MNTVSNPYRVAEEHAAFPLPKAKLGLWVFLGVVTILFAALLSAYVVRMGLEDWVSLPKPWMLWANTAALALSSVAFQAAFVAARNDRPAAIGPRLWAGGALGALFVLGQLWVWQQLVGWGYFAAGNPANTFFYLITALHGAHLLGGLVAWANTLVKARRGASLERLRLSIEVCAIYWHFLLAAWLVLFGLLWLT